MHVISVKSLRCAGTVLRMNAHTRALSLKYDVDVEARAALRESSCQ